MIGGRICKSKRLKKKRNKWIRTALIELVNVSIPQMPQNLF